MLQAVMQRNSLCFGVDYPAVGQVQGCGEDIYPDLIHADIRNMKGNVIRPCPLQSHGHKAIQQQKTNSNQG